LASNSTAALLQGWQISPPFQGPWQENGQVLASSSREKIGGPSPGVAPLTFLLRPMTFADLLGIIQRSSSPKRYSPVLIRSLKFMFHVKHPEHFSDFLNLGINS
jgi:hypothetical protein